MRPQPGDLINGKYRLIRLIGDGGMGTVFEARHEYLGTTVALKFLHSELARRPGLVQRFLQEARLSASIKSHHIARVTDVDQAGEGAAYLVMELLEGSSLQALLERQKVLPQAVALDYTLQILAGLEAAHTVGVVHRDLKPDNVFVVSTPRGPLVKLLDFGIAKLRSSKEFQVGLTRPGVVMGTPEYMAPEQAYSADSVDARADVYSVGAMLYEMLSGRRPALGDDAQQIAAFILAKRVPYLSQLDPSIPGPLADVIHHAMEPLASARFGSVAELREALIPFCGNLSLAGSLAATPAPPAGGVAPTLPPEAMPTPEPYAVAKSAATPAIPATPGVPSFSASATPAATVEAAPWAPTAAPAYAYQPAPTPHGNPAPIHYGNTGGPPPPRARRSRGFSMWLLLGMLVLTVAIVAIAMATAETTDKKPSAESVTTSAVVAPAPKVPPVPAVETTAPVAIAPPVQPGPTPVAQAPQTAPKTPKPAHPADAGAGSADASTIPTVPGFPRLPFPFPSSFPSSLPPLPLPSGFPPFSIPGFPQPVAPTPSR